MRSDYALYIVAIIFFVITAISYIVLEELTRSLFVVSTTVLGLLFLLLGYILRPKPKAITVEAPPALPATVTPAASTVTEAIKVEKTETIVEAAPSAPPRLELTAVKGIKEKRAAQLKALGINTVEDLANASAKDLAAKLKISPKFTEPWIENAKKLLEKS